MASRHHRANRRGDEKSGAGRRQQQQQQHAVVTPTYGLTELIVERQIGNLPSPPSLGRHGSNGGGPHLSMSGRRRLQMLSRKESSDTAREFPSDEESSTAAAAAGHRQQNNGKTPSSNDGMFPTLMSDMYETSETESSLSSPPGRHCVNNITPDQGFFPSSSSSITGGSAGPSPTGRQGTRPVASSQTPPRAPPVPHTTAASFLKPRGNACRPAHKGRVLFGPNGMGVVNVPVGIGIGAAGSQLPVQQAQAQAQAQAQQQATAAPFTDRGRKRRAYSANGPLSSSLSSSAPSSSSASSAASSNNPTSMLPSPSRMGAGASGLFSRGAGPCGLTPHLSPGSIGLESMSIRSPKNRDYINETSVGGAPAPPPPDLSRHVESAGDGSMLGGGGNGNGNGNNNVSSSRHGSCNLSGNNTPTQTLQTPQLSPPGRQGIRMPCPQFSSSSAFGSVTGNAGGSVTGGGPGSSVGGGSCFGLFRSRTPSPNPGALLGKGQQHRRNGSAASGAISAMSATTSTSGRNNFDTSLDSSAVTAVGDLMAEAEGGCGSSASATKSPSQLPLPSPRHVPLMVLTKKSADDNGDSPSGRGLAQDFDHEEVEKEDRKDQDASEDEMQLEQLLEAAVPAAKSSPSTPAAAAIRSPRVSSTAASSVASPAARFGLSPRKPLPSSMLSPRLEQSPMIQSPALPSSKGPPPPRAPAPFLIPRRSAKDGKMVDLLFGDDDSPPPSTDSKKPHQDASPPAPATTSSKPPPFPTHPAHNHEGADMGAVMDGLLMGFNRSAGGRSGLTRQQQFESTNSLAFSMGSSNNSLDHMKSAAEHYFPIKSLSFGGPETDEKKMPATKSVSSPPTSSSSPPSSSQATPIRSGLIGLEFPQGFKARSVLTPSKSGGSLQRLLDADRARREEDLDDGSLSDSCDDSRGPKDMFFLNSPEAVTAETIHAAEIENSAGRSPDDAYFADGRERKRRSTNQPLPLTALTMPMEISETYRNSQGQVSAEAEAIQTSTSTTMTSMTSNAQSSSSSSTVQSKSGENRRSSLHRRNGSSSNNLKKQRSVTFSPSPEVPLSATAPSFMTKGARATVAQTSTSSLYGMDIVQEESTAQDGKVGEQAAEPAVSFVTPGPHQNTEQVADAYLFSAITSKSRSESGDTLSIPGGSHFNLHQFNKRQSFGSSGSLLAHFNNLNKQESEVSLNFGNPGDFGGLRRASSKDSALGLPIGQDDDDANSSRPPSRAMKMYTPPPRDLITPPAQTFSIGASGIAGGRALSSPPPISSKWKSNGNPGDEKDDFDAPPNWTSSSGGAIGHNDEKRTNRTKFLCVAPADKDSVKLAIARMAMEAAHENSSF